jgi:hypothetical protein
MWYRARVLCDKAREAADYYHIDPLDLSERVEPYVSKTTIFDPPLTTYFDPPG